MQMGRASLVYARKKRASADGDHDLRCRKRLRPLAAAAAFLEVEEAAGGGSGVDFFDGLPDDLVLSILCKLSSSAASPSDLVNITVTCKRLNGLGLQPLVLSKASAKSLAVPAKKWSDSVHRFLKRCVDAKNLEACYILGMIRFYCLGSKGSGAALMAKAALRSHAPALYSLAVIQFNGSGGTKNDKDLRAGVALCYRAAVLGHVDALRELGHCLQDGYGVRKNVAEGRRFLIQANARELASFVPIGSNREALLAWHRHQTAAAAEGKPAAGCPLLSDFGWCVPAPEPHPANRFLSEWFAARGGGGSWEDGLRMCSHSGCGRPETRRHEFRRCSVCGSVNYCSRACQALDWKLSHKSECLPLEDWFLDAAGDDAGGPVVEDGDLGGGGGAALSG